MTLRHPFQVYIDFNQTCYTLHIDDTLREKIYFGFLCNIMPFWHGFHHIQDTFKFNKVNVMVIHEKISDKERIK